MASADLRLHSDSPARRGPRHFYLLFEEDLETLRPMLRMVLERMDDVINYWYQLYVVHFGDDRTLGELEFNDLYRRALTGTTAHLVDGDMDQYAIDTIRAAERLAERRVPFAEVVASLHLYEEAVYHLFAPSPPPIEIYTCFDKLSHVRIILIADAYFRSEVAVAGARIKALEREAARLPRSQRLSFHGLVGVSQMMRHLYDRIEAVGETRGTVLIIGESGTGKELVARAIHECGVTAAAPFVALNCAAIPRDLIESELFGHKRGAFSGANAEYLGLFRAADGGTLFLDEVTEMSPETQTKLLRALQERTVRPVGSTSEIPVSVRLIASTNRDPEDAMRNGQLRQDLYYRLQAGVLQVAPLRERSEDIPLLVEHFIALFNEKLKPRILARGVEEDALRAMTRYSWPGNVRELSNAIESALTFGRSPLIALDALPSALHLQGNGGNTGAAKQSLGTFADAERDVIARALETTGGNKLAAAKLLGISRKKLYAKIAKYGL
ncbi:MAG TPA: sigma-54 dependent transcriptional regulator [Candidatus Binataceae bacterium]|nr:sigma-54 dependent transcriptional regulator [Candidatus Binataceae bacterium]